MTDTTGLSEDDILKIADASPLRTGDFRIIRPSDVLAFARALLSAHQNQSEHVAVNLAVQSSPGQCDSLPVYAYEVTDSRKNSHMAYAGWFHKYGNPFDPDCTYEPLVRLCDVQSGCAASQRDAERYQYLRAGFRPAPGLPRIVYIEGGEAIALSEAMADEKVDAAIRQLKEPAQ